MERNGRNEFNAVPIIDLSPEELSSGQIANATVQQAVSLMTAHGVVQLNDILPRQYVEVLRDDYLQKYAAGDPEKAGGGSLHVGHLRFMITVEIKDAFNDIRLFSNPFCEPILSALLGRRYVMDSFGSVCAFPGSQPQHVHRDHPRLFEARGVTERLPPYAITLAIPLEDLDLNVGTTAAWLGSHRWHRIPSEKLNSLEVFLPLPRMGSCYFMDYRLVHGGTTNSSTRPRALLYLVYSRSWFKDCRNYRKQPKIKISPSEFEKVPEEAKRLFGWPPPLDLG